MVLLTVRGLTFFETDSGEMQPDCNLFVCSLSLLVLCLQDFAEYRADNAASRMQIDSISEKAIIFASTLCTAISLAVCAVDPISSPSLRFLAVVLFFVFGLVLLF